MREAKCSICNGDFDLHQLFCMVSQRGANSLCREHPHMLICMKCGGFEEELKCPYCESANITLPLRTSLGGKKITCRQCHNCLKVFNPNGTKISDSQLFSQG